MIHPEVAWLLAGAAAWWIGATGAAVRRDVVALEDGGAEGETYALIARLGRFRDHPVSLGLRGRISRMLSAAFLPFGLGAAAARLPWEITVFAVLAGWLVGAGAEAAGGGPLARRLGRARGGMGYGIWARVVEPLARLGRPLLRLRLTSTLEEDVPARVLAESETSRAAGAAELGRQELRFLRRILASKGILVTDIATKWEIVCWVPHSSSPAAASAAIRDSGHSRLPVVGERGVLGLVTVKDLLGRAESTIGALPLRPVYFVREDLTARDLLEELRAARAHLAVTVDRLGRETGIVTMEDVLEEIVGELHDEREAPVR